MKEHDVRRATWPELGKDDLYETIRLRYRVFALEQHVTEEDFDGRDREPETEHWWVADSDGSALAYLRLIRPTVAESDQAAWVIGRVAVDRPSRGKGLARRLVDEVLAVHGHEPFLLHAQEYVAGLYEKSGFVVFGSPYVEAGIRHVSMQRPATG